MQFTFIPFESMVWSSATCTPVQCAGLFEKASTMLSLDDIKKFLLSEKRLCAHNFSKVANYKVANPRVRRCTFLIWWRSSQTRKRIPVSGVAALTKERGRFLCLLRTPRSLLVLAPAHIPSRLCPAIVKQKNFKSLFFWLQFNCLHITL